MAKSDSTTVRVSRDVHRRLKKLADEEGATLSEVIARLLDEQRRDRFFRRTNKGFSRLRSDQERWAHYKKETEDLEGASDDGLKDFPYDG